MKPQQNNKIPRMTTDSTNRARQLRERQTKAESLIWTVLRAKQLGGLKFRRQHPIATFFADFACVSRKVIVELDGGYHDYQYEDDATRQTFFGKSRLDGDSILQRRRAR